MTCTLDDKRWLNDVFIPALFWRCRPILKEELMDGWMQEKEIDAEVNDSNAFKRRLLLRDEGIYGSRHDAKAIYTLALGVGYPGNELQAWNYFRFGGLSYPSGAGLGDLGKKLRFTFGVFTDVFIEFGKAFGAKRKENIAICHFCDIDLLDEVGAIAQLRHQIEDRPDDEGIYVGADWVLKPKESLTEVLIEMDLQRDYLKI